MLGLIEKFCKKIDASFRYLRQENLSPASTRAIRDWILESGSPGFEACFTVSLLYDLGQVINNSKPLYVPLKNGILSSWS